MGFHWEWCAIKATGENVRNEIKKLLTPPLMAARELTFEGVYATLEAYASPAASWLASCTFQGWTFFTGTVTPWGGDLVRIAKSVGVDACSAIAESTTWDLLMEYAKPDGSVRSRSFAIEGTESGGMPELTLVTGTAGDGPLRRDDEGREEREGPVLEGEPLDVQIADDVRLLKVLTAVGVPLEALRRHYIGDFDWKRLEAIPGPGRAEKAFTLFIEGPLKIPQQAAMQKKGRFARLFGK